MTDRQAETETGGRGGGQLVREDTKPGGWVRSSPAVADDTVYVGTEDRVLHTVDSNSGEQVWTLREPPRRVYSSPAVVDGTVYVGSADKRLYAVDKASDDWPTVSGGSYDIETSRVILVGERPPVSIQQDVSSQFRECSGV